MNDNELALLTGLMKAQTDSVQKQLDDSVQQIRAEFAARVRSNETDICDLQTKLKVLEGSLKRTAKDIIIEGYLSLIPGGTMLILAYILLSNQIISFAKFATGL